MKTEKGQTSHLLLAYAVIRPPATSRNSLLSCLRLSNPLMIGFLIIASCRKMSSLAVSWASHVQYLAIVRPATENTHSDGAEVELMHAQQLVITSCTFL